MLSLILIFLATFLFLEWLSSKPKNYPPGPPCFPIIGSTPFFESKNFHLFLERIQDKYGPLVGFKLGPRCVIGVGGVKHVKEVLTREEFQGRPMIVNVKPGIMFSEGNFWAIQRKFTVKHLREFGFGKKTVEHVVLQEAEEFFQNVLRKRETIQVSGLFSLSVINVLWAMIAGKRFRHDDKDFVHLLYCLQRSFRAGDVSGGISSAFPALRKILVQFGFFQEEKKADDLLNEFLQVLFFSPDDDSIRQSCRNVDEFVFFNGRGVITNRIIYFASNLIAAETCNRKTIDGHRKTKTEEPRDFIDVYLTEMEKTDLDPSFSEFTLRNVCLDLFAAGSESVGNSISFLLLYCVLYPDWQEKLHREIIDYDDSVPYLSGMERLPMVEAFISEVSRCNTIATITVPHRAVKDTQLDNYIIPKDSILLVSLWSVHQDKQLWGDPKNFRPERFLQDGKYRRDVGWLPVFGTGKRICPAETLAKNITLVFFVALLKEFKFSIPEGHGKPSKVCMPGFTNAPQPFYVKITRR